MIDVFSISTHRAGSHPLYQMAIYLSAISTRLDCQLLLMFLANLAKCSYYYLFGYGDKRDVPNFIHKTRI